MTTLRENILEDIMSSLSGTTGVGARIYRSRVVPLQRGESPALSSGRACRERGRRTREARAASRGARCGPRVHRRGPLRLRRAPMIVRRMRRLVQGPWCE